MSAGYVYEQMEQDYIARCERHKERLIKSGKEDGEASNVAFGELDKSAIVMEGGPEDFE